MVHACRTWLINNSEVIIMPTVSIAMNVTADGMTQGNDLWVMWYLQCKSTQSQRKAFLLAAKPHAWHHTGYSVIFRGDVQKGVKLVSPVNNHVDSGHVRYRWEKRADFQSLGSTWNWETIRGKFTSRQQPFVNFLTMSHTCKRNCCFDKKHGHG